MTTPNGDIREHRVERAMAYMVAGTVGLSIICIFALIIGSASGLTQAQLQSGIWPTVYWVPAVGLPIGLILIIALLITSSVRRSREARGDKKS